MGFATGLERRGAVYYWRKRLPDRLAERIGLTHVKLSLRTRDPQEARYLGACLNKMAAELLMSVLPEITREQLQSLFRKTFEQHRRKLALLADFARSERGFMPSQEIQEETATGWAYQHFSRNGLHASVDEDARDRFAKVGLSEEEIERVTATVDRMKASGEATPSASRLAEAITETGAEVTAATKAKAQPIYLRALAEALLKTDERYRHDPFDYDAEICALAPEAEGLSEAERGFRPASRTTSELRENGPARGDTSTPPSRPSPTPSMKTAAAHTGSVIAISTKLIEKKLADEVWDEKTARQARMIFDLFGRFLTEEAGVNDLAELRQHHLDAFEIFLRILHKTYGKSPKDRHRTIADLRKDSEQRPSTERGLSGATRNRHLTFIGQLLRRAKSAGVAIDPQLDLTELRARKNKRGRDDRPVPTRIQIETLFHQPVFTGCGDWDDMHRLGEHIFHRAAYFGPLLANYQGMRREEYCGLSADDIITDNGDHPYIHLCFNEFRRLKNPQSVRNLALHPELIRLSFLDYVDAIRKLGYRRLFPDLHSPSSHSLLGDRLYDELRPSFQTCGFTLHQSRHFFNNELKQMRVDAEFRADLMGHGGKTETTERYCNPADVVNQLEDLSKVPIVTAHLSPHAIRLVPWVEEKAIAPWSRAAKAKAKA
ncbi:DUF6538 domain-containing protein [Fulvimarina manganoxydans]|uniref:DUF6538 domain-containing protein n=1 Tax=Fulvimarina manganoxydans TaxID=937218 RepID=UPI002353AB8C|nr:DUF6538 domain-containing protein [Fulvimarina manganoxydans]